MIEYKEQALTQKLVMTTVLTHSMVHVLTCDRVVSSLGGHEQQYKL